MEKRKYPKTVMRKKVIKGAFWTGFTLVLFLSIVAIVRVGNANAGATEEKSVEQVTKVENIAAGEGGKTYAQNFAQQYFNWQNTDDAKKKRIERLSPYLAEGLDEQAGLVFDGSEWNSNFVSSQVWKVESVGNDAALITLVATHELQKVTKFTPKQTKKQKKKKIKPKEIEKIEKSGPYKKYIVIPVKTDGQSFAVYKTPYFVAGPKKVNIQAQAAISDKEKINDTKLQNEMKTFLNTFFKVYTTGSQEELSYYIKDDKIRSMNGIVTFKEVKEFAIRKGDGKNRYKIELTGVFEENKSKAKMIYPYELSVKKEDKRWFLETIKH